MKKIILILIFASAILKAEDFKFYNIIEDFLRRPYNSLHYDKIKEFLQKELSKEEFIELYDINTSERFINDVLLKTELDYEDYYSYRKRYLLVKDSIDFDGSTCMVYFDYETNILYYYDYNNFRFVKQVKNPFIREVFYSEKYFTFFTDQYDFVSIDLLTGDVVSKILPYAVITGDVIIMDDLLITTQHNGIAAYDIKTGEKQWINFETIVLPSRIKKYNNNLFYFLYENRVKVINYKNGEIVNEYQFDPDEFIAHIDYGSGEIVLLSFEKIIFKNIFTDEEKKYDIAKIHEYYPFYSKNEYLYLINNELLLRSKLEGDDKGFEVVKKIEKIEDEQKEEVQNDSTLEKEPYINLEYLQKQLLYPEIARLHGIEQKMILYVECSRDGYPKRITIESFSSYLYLEEFFYEAATAVLKTKIDPALQNGEQTVFAISVPVSYRLR